MAGAISGAHLGIGGLPARLVNLLENSPKGRGYLSALSKRLIDVHDRIASGGDQVSGS
jgi:hypothetical protein